MKRLHILYSGRVQGVSFRYTAQSIASRCGVGGWVKNLPDGRVEVVAEADEAKLKAFERALSQEMAYYISDARVNFEPAANNFSGFNIKF